MAGGWWLVGCPVGVEWLVGVASECGGGWWGWQVGMGWLEGLWVR